MRKKNIHIDENIPFTKLPGGVTKQKKILSCGVQHTSKFRLDIEAAGLALNDASAATQCQALLRILIYQGARGINTLEGVACGFLRIATRIQELEDDGHVIASIKEHVKTADGLIHKGIARYVLVTQTMPKNQQGTLDLGCPE